MKTRTMAYDEKAVVRSALALMEVMPAMSVVAVARSCGVSRQTLARAFTRFGPSSVAQARRRALRHRVALLMTHCPPLSIKEISASAGFSTPQVMARWVRREYGVSPRMLRSLLLSAGWTSLRISAIAKAERAHP